MIPTDFWLVCDLIITFTFGFIVGYVIGGIRVKKIVREIVETIPQPRRRK